MGRGQAKLFVLWRGLMAGSRCQGRLVLRLDDCVLLVSMAVVCNDTLCDGGETVDGDPKSRGGDGGPENFHVAVFCPRRSEGGLDWID